METSKIVTYELWYDYVKQRYGEKAKLCYVDTSSFIVHIKIADFVKDVEKKLDTSNYELDHSLKKRFLIMISNPLQTHLTLLRKK